MRRNRGASTRDCNRQDSRERERGNGERPRPAGREKPRRHARATNLTAAESPRYALLRPAAPPWGRRRLQPGDGAMKRPRTLPPVALRSRAMQTPRPDPHLRDRFRRTIPRASAPVVGSGPCHRWSQGPLVEAFERSVGALERARRQLPTSSWSGAAMAALEYAGVRARGALPRRIRSWRRRSRRRPPATRRSRRLQPRRSLRLVRRLPGQGPDPSAPAAFLVHIGGHIAFDVDRIAAFCRSEGIFLIEDSAHSSTDLFHRRRPGPGATRLMVLRRDQDDLYRRGRRARVQRRRPLTCRSATTATTASRPTAQPGLNLRMNEFTAALGIVGAERLEEITAWKNAAARGWLDPVHPERVELPYGMIMGSNKYIVFRARRALDREGLRRTVSPDHAHIKSHCRTPTGWRPTTGAFPCIIGPSLGRKKGRLCESPRHGRVGLHWLARCRPVCSAAATSRGSSISSPPTASRPGRRHRRRGHPRCERRTRRSGGAMPSCTLPQSLMSTRWRATRCAPISSTHAAPP